VQEILVKEGEQVKQGQVLMRHGYPACQGR